MTTQVFLSEFDQEILYLLARGKTQTQIAAQVGKNFSSVTQRVQNMQRVFSATTVAHLVAIAIASDIIYVPDLYEESLAESVHVRSRDGEAYHPRSKRLEIQQAVMR